MPIYVNDLLINTITFSGGELHIRLDTLPNIKTTIYAELNSSDDIMTLLLIVDALRRQHSKIILDLVIPYFPYARQDRVCNPGEAFSLKVMTNLINSLNCNTVTVYDPHSGITPELINNCIVKRLTDLINNTSLTKFISKKNLIIVSPDAGSEKKVMTATNQLNAAGLNIEILYANKVRDSLTGNIIETRILGDVKQSSYLILDDICDGGRTFIELAKKLKENGAKDIYLYVTHGIFSKGFSTLEKYFTHIFCYHTVNCPASINSDLITLLKKE